MNSSNSDKNIKRNYPLAMNITNTVASSSIEEVGTPGVPSSKTTVKNNNTVSLVTNFNKLFPIQFSN
jgi:hypothetical protein